MTADNDMVAIAAEAIFQEWARRFVDGDVKVGSDWEAFARAVIRSMRRPTKAMLDAASPHMDSPSSNIAWWEAMIDAALKREGE